MLLFLTPAQIICAILFFITFNFVIFEGLALTNGVYSEEHFKNGNWMWFSLTMLSVSLLFNFVRALSSILSDSLC